MKISVLMAAYNEHKWIAKSAQRVLSQKINGVTDIELVIVDDGSTDGTTDIIRDLKQMDPQRIKSIFHGRNRGKGAAIRTAIEQMTGELCIIQDADLEYDPSDYNALLEPLLDGRADCVYGSRWQGSPKRVLFYWHGVGNKLITTLSNMLTNYTFSDIETGYKAFRSDILRSIPIRSDDFGLEPEITAKIAKRKCRVYEVGISYSGRTYKDGKKINWTDGFKALLTIFKFWILNDSIKK